MRWWRGGAWFAARRQEAQQAVRTSQEDLKTIESARESARADAEYLRGERRKNHFRQAVEAAWKGSTA